MSVSEQQILLRAANENEHAEIEKQILGWAKMLVTVMAVIMLLCLIACVMIYIEMRKDGIPAVIAFFSLAAIMSVYGIILLEMCTPLFRIPKRQYMVADGIVTKKIKKTHRGVSYFAMVSYADGTNRKVRINSEKMYEKTEIGSTAQVIYFLKRNGKTRKHSYCLIVL